MRQSARYSSKERAVWAEARPSAEAGDFPAADTAEAHADFAHGLEEILKGYYKSDIRLVSECTVRELLYMIIKHTLEAL